MARCITMKLGEDKICFSLPNTFLQLSTERKSFYTRHAPFLFFLKSTEMLSKVLLFSEAEANGELS